MNAKKSISPITRRTFLRNGAILTAAAATLTRAGRAQTNKNSKLRIFQIGCGGIGDLQRGQLKGYERSEFVGFCDVDQKELDSVVKQYPGSWKVVDYREAFANKVNDFDAVIVDIPDFHHAGAMLNALKHNKHIYGQKPLVHQLDELRMVKEALEAKPNLVTQMGNQRACNTGRMHAVEILKRGQLGKPIEAYVWTGGVSRGHYFGDPWEELRPGSRFRRLELGSLQWPVGTTLPYPKIGPAALEPFWKQAGTLAIGVPLPIG